MLSVLFGTVIIYIVRSFNHAHTSFKNVPLHLPSVVDFPTLFSQPGNDLITFGWRRQTPENERDFLPQVGVEGVEFQSTTIQISLHILVVGHSLFELRTQKQSVHFFRLWWHLLEKYQLLKPWLLYCRWYLFALGLGGLTPLGPATAVAPAKVWNSAIKCLIGEFYENLYEVKCSQTVDQTNIYCTVFWGKFRSFLASGSLSLLSF